MNGIEYDGWVPSHVREYLKELGYRLPLEDMEPHIAALGVHQSTFYRWLKEGEEAKSGVKRALLAAWRARVDEILVHLYLHRDADPRFPQG